MKKEISRERDLPAFKTDLAGIGFLIDKLLSLFPEGKCHTSITIKTNNEEFSFEAAHEVANVRELPDRVTSFSLRISEGDRRLFFYPGGFMGSAARITAVADSEAWCAGAIETALQFFRQNRTWYSWFRGWPIGALLLLNFNTPFIMAALGLSSRFVAPNVLITWIVSLLIAFTLYSGRGRLLPSAILEIRRTESIIRRYISELTLLVSLLALILTIIGWFIKK